MVQYLKHNLFQFFDNLAIFICSAIIETRDSGAPSEDLEGEIDASIPTNEDETNETDDVFEENISNKSDAEEEGNEDLK